MSEISVVFRTMLPFERLKSLAAIVRNVSNLEGELWDVGCHLGGSAAVMGEAIPKKHIRLFDSFEGLPESTEEDGQNRRNQPVGMFAVPCPSMLQFLGSVHKGWVPETFKGLENSKIVLAHIDLDYYKGTKAALQFVLPRIVLNGYVIVDDYDSGWAGVKPAVDEVIGRNFIKLESPPEQAIFQCTAIS